LKPPHTLSDDARYQRLCRNVSHRMCRTECLAQNVSHRMSRVERLAQNVSRRLSRPECLAQNVSRRMPRTECLRQNILPRMSLAGSLISCKTHRVFDTLQKCLAQNLSHRMSQRMSRTVIDMGWLRLACSLKLHVSFAKKPFERDHILQKSPMISMSRTVCDTLHRQIP